MQRPPGEPWRVGLERLAVPGREVALNHCWAAAITAKQAVTAVPEAHGPSIAFVLVVHGVVEVGYQPGGLVAPMVVPTQHWCLIRSAQLPVAVRLSLGTVLFVVTCPGLQLPTYFLTGPGQGVFHREHVFAHLLYDLLQHLTRMTDLGALADPLEQLIFDVLDGFLLETIQLTHAHSGPWPPYRDLYREALRYLRLHYQEPSLRPEAIATALNVSLPTLKRRFRARGTSLSRQLRQLRVEHALALIEDAGYAAVTLDLVAQTVGLANASCLRTAFLTQGLDSPQNYRHP